MTCETCGAPTGWVDGGRLTSANESKREAMLVQRQQHDRIATLEQQNAELVAALNSALEIVTTDCRIGGREMKENICQEA